MAKAKTLAGLVDELGELGAEIEPLQKTQRELTKLIKDIMSGEALACAEGEGYRAELVSSRAMVIDPAAFASLLGPRRKAAFMACVRVEKREALKHFEEAALEPISRFEVSVRLVVKGIVERRSVETVAAK